MKEWRQHQDPVAEEEVEGLRKGCVGREWVNRRRRGRGGVWRKDGGREEEVDKRGRKRERELVKRRWRRE